MAVNAYGQYTISIVDDGVGIKSKQDYYTLSNQKDSLDGAKSYFEKEVSGTIASFSDGAEDAPMSVVVDIDPVQEGSGDPSPDNIRPISGRTGAKVTRTGRNLVEDSLVGYNIIANGTFEHTSSFTMQIAQVKKGVQYTKTAGDDYFVGGYFTEKPTPSSVTYNNSRIVELANTFTAPIDGYVVFRTASSFATPQLELGSTAHAYEPYTAVTHEIPFSTEVYGGKLNVETGELVVDRALVDMGTRTWTYIQPSTAIPYGTFYNTIRNKKFGQTNLICSTYSVKQGFRYDYAIQGNSGANTVYVTDSTYNGDANALKTAVTGQTICYELATPITLTLTPVEIRSLFGDNNVFADTGDVDVKYINEQDLTWETEPLVPNEEGKYLWWKYKITKDDDSTWESDPAVIGMFSDSDRVLANIEKAQNTADFAQGAAQMAQSSANYAQDAADRAQQSANNAQSSADQANEGVTNLRSEVASNYVTISDFSVSNESIQSSVTEVRTIAEAAQLSADANYSDLSGNLEDLEGRVSTNETSISSIATTTSNLEQRADSINLTVEEHTREIEELQGYTTGLKATMNLTASGLDISGGDTTANTKVHINGNGVSIMDGDNVPAYFHGQDSKMINVEVTELLRIGNHKLLARSGGTNTTVVYVGDE